MSYIVLARKWRPQTFEEVIGQEHVTTTLKNAIKQDRVAHAYLFCGPRGIGKTTTARILAKALNCEKGPTPTPCNKCTSCKEITSANSLDIIEIDGASNRGIDEIRNIKENIKFSPQHGKFKIYIIDEVHMLTQEAFNALLKTLEEPPAHIKFIFATTAAHKLIPTILSRCQRFNFKRLSSVDIAKKLKEIASKEKISIEESALYTIVRAASGSMRDAESVLDQLSTYCKNKITSKDTNSILGAIEQQSLSEFAKFVVSKDASGAIKLINRIIDDGVDPSQFLLNLIEYFRNAMLIKEGKDLSHLIELSKDQIKDISKNIDSLTREDIMYILYSLISTNDMMRNSSSQKMSLELLAVKLSQKESIVSLDEIMKRLNSLEKKRAAQARVSIVAENIDNPIKTKETSKPEALSAELNPLEDEIQNLEGLESRPELYKIREAMPHAIKGIRQEKIYIASCLNEGKLINFVNNIITIGFPKKNTFHKESLEKAQNKELIESHFSKVLNEKIRVEFVVIRDDSHDATKGSSESTPSKEKKNSLKKALSDPIIQSALDIFDGNIMKFM